MLDCEELRKVKSKYTKKPTVDDKNIKIPHYDHNQYFLKLNDDSKILATINNDYSTIKNQA